MQRYLRHAEEKKVRGYPGEPEPKSPNILLPAELLVPRRKLCPMLLLTLVKCRRVFMRCSETREANPTTRKDFMLLAERRHSPVQRTKDFCGTPRNRHADVLATRASSVKRKMWVSKTVLKWIEIHTLRASWDGGECRQVGQWDFHCCPRPGKLTQRCDGLRPWNIDRLDNRIMSSHVPIGVPITQFGM